MKERLFTVSLAVGEVGVTLGDLFIYTLIPCSATLVGVIASPSVDDAGLTLDIDNVTTTTSVIAATTCAVKATPGSWRAIGFGGTQTPVQIAAGNILSFDANAAAANTTLNITLYLLSGESA